MCPACRNKNKTNSASGKDIRSNGCYSQGKLYIVGIGPGSKNQITPEASKIINKSQIIIGYKTYIYLLKKMITLEKKEIYAFSMREELTRAKKAIELTQSGKKVAVISGGDPGIYGMAGVVLEIMQKQKLDLEIEIIPGVPAFCAASSLLGAALMNDFALISLSDLFTPLEIIKKRIISAIKGDFVIILYNPSSKSRKKQIKEIHSLLLEYKPPQTPLGIVWQAKRSGERMLITTLEKMPAHQINMSATIIIGNSSTYLFNKYLITPRGYKI